jgi:hypothetical protein
MKMGTAEAGFANRAEENQRMTKGEDDAYERRGYGINCNHCCSASTLKAICSSLAHG